MDFAGVVFMRLSRRKLVSSQLGVSPVFLALVAFVETWVTVVSKMYLAYLKDDTIKRKQKQKRETSRSKAKSTKSTKSSPPTDLEKALKVELHLFDEIQSFMIKQRNASVNSVDSLSRIYKQACEIFMSATVNERAIFEECFEKANKRFAKLQDLRQSRYRLAKKNDDADHDDRDGNNDDNDHDHDDADDDHDDNEDPLDYEMQEADAVHRYASKMLDAVETIRQYGTLIDRMPGVPLLQVWERLKFQAQSILSASASWNNVLQSCREQSERIEQLEDLIRSCAVSRRHELYWQKDWLETLHEWHMSH
jgi:hypothetical protein